ncbi:hypothetical protein CBL_13396 [Carabus blaptoides fortunei]
MEQNGRQVRQSEEERVLFQHFASPSCQSTPQKREQLKNLPTSDEQRTWKLEFLTTLVLVCYSTQYSVYIVCDVHYTSVLRRIGAPATDSSNIRTRYRPVTEWLLNARAENRSVVERRIGTGRKPERGRQPASQQCRITMLGGSCCFCRLTSRSVADRRYLLGHYISCSENIIVTYRPRRALPQTYSITQYSSASSAAWNGGEGEREKEDEEACVKRPRRICYKLQSSFKVNGDLARSGLWV